MYRVHSVKIHAEDRAKADDILAKHISDIDDIRITAQKTNSGISEATYWIKPYIYEDFGTIVNEFKEAGIRVL